MVDLGKLLSQKENINLECKLAKGGIPGSIWETYSAFANTSGRTILLGIEESKHTFIPVGVSNPAQIISDFWNLINNSQKVSGNILYDRHVYPVCYKNKDIVVIEVPRANRQDKPVYIGNNMFSGSFRRNGEGDYHCQKEEVLAMLRDQAEESADNRLLEQLLLEDLNPESIRRYKIMFGNLKPNHIWTQLTDEEFLVKIGAAKRGNDKKLHPNLAGLLFFGEFATIVDVLPNYFLDYRERMADETRWSDRVCTGDGTWSGNIFDFYFKVIDRLTADVKTPFELRDGLIRIDDTQVHVVLREALANSLIHADYYGRRGIVIDKAFRKITISNPGTFRISIDEAIAGGISDARNSRIFNMFSLINVGERSGSGLCDLFYTWQMNGFMICLLYHI